MERAEEDSGIVLVGRGCTGIRLRGPNGSLSVLHDDLLARWRGMSFRSSPCFPDGRRR